MQGFSRPLFASRAEAGRATGRELRAPRAERPPRFRRGGEGMDMVAVGDGALKSVTPLLGTQEGFYRRCSCGQMFAERRADQRYCSKRCKDTAYNRAHPVTRQARLDFTPAASELAHAVRGRETKANRILARLKEGPATSLNLLAVGGLRYGARIHELRQQGHTITREDNVQGGQEWSVYTLEGDK